MTLILQQDQIQAMNTHAESTYPEECCGLLLGIQNAEENRRWVHELRPMENQWTPEMTTLTEVSSSSNSSNSNEQNLNAQNLIKQGLTKENRYWIDPKALMEAQRYGRDRGWIILGVYHSHPEHPAEPSERDRRLAWSEYSYPIMSVTNGKVVDIRSWQLGEDGQFRPETIDFCS